jgi:hypothetical protein
VQQKNNESIFSNVRLLHGNFALLGRAILAAEQSCKDLGVTLEITFAHEFLNINQQNRQTWLPVASIFNPNFSDVSPNNSLYIIGRNEHNEVVACQACRFFDWSNTTFKEECESLRLWYDDPNTKKNNNEQAIVNTLAGSGTTGKVCYSGAAWYRPDFRGKGLVEFLPRLARAYAAGVWGTTTTITLMAENNVKKGVFPRNGYRNIEWYIDVINNQSGTIRFAYLWIKNDEMESDLNDFLSGLRSRQIVGSHTNVG